jgi:GT2 family glycosyltransferase
MKIAFICVNYNNSNYTKEFVDSVLIFKKDCILKIIVVDNASEKQDLIKLDQMIFPEVTILKSSENVGYFRGLNVGIDSINVAEYDFIVVGNNDLVFDKNFISNLTSISFNENIFVVAPSIIKLDGTHQNPHILKKFTKVQRVYRHFYFKSYYSSIILQKSYNMFRLFLKQSKKEKHVEPFEILMGYGACYVLTPHFFKDSNCLEAPCFLMGEEGVLANQISRFRGKTMYVPALIVNHHDHTSIGKLPSKTMFDYNREAYYNYLNNCKLIH